mgnify:CR=1 FL=1
MRYKAVEGYNRENYDKKKGIVSDITEDKISYNVVMQVCDMILDGYTDTTIKNLLYELYGINSYQVKFITNYAHRELKNREEKQSENLREKQLSRLFKLYRDAETIGDMQTQLKILAEINKLGNLYKERIEINDVNYKLNFD